MITFTCVLLFIGEAGAESEDLMEPGPYKVGYVDDNMTVTTVRDWFREKGPNAFGSNPPGTKYSCPVRYYYPAIEHGEAAEPDKSEAPYITIFFSPDFEKTNLTDYQDMLTHMASWGMVVMTFGTTSPAMGNGHEEIDHFRDRIYQVENLTDNSSSILYGMVDKDALATMGHYWGGMRSGSLCMYNRQIKVDIDLAPFTTGTHFWEDPEFGGPAVRDQQILIMAGANDAASLQVSNSAFDAYSYYMKEGGSVTLVTLPESDENGPWQLDLCIAFLFYHLAGMDEYETYLYGEEMVNDGGAGRYTVEYTRSEDSFFPPIPEIILPTGPVYMETDLELKLDFVGYPQLRDYPDLTIDWYIDNDGDVIDSNHWSVNFSFPIPDKYKASAKWTVGIQYGWISPIYLEVENMPPVADPGPDMEVDQDVKFVFDGGTSLDTLSHIEDLEFKWSLSDGHETEYSSDPTCTRGLTEVGLLVATLTVRDPLGAETSAICNITVNNVHPAVAAEGDKEALEDEDIQFTGTGTDSPSHIGSLMYRWEFGDDTETEWADFPDAAHTYTTEDSFIVILWVKDPLDAMGSASLVVEVKNVAPEAGIDTPEDGSKFKVKKNIVFTGWGIDTPSDNATLKYIWDFGDGTFGAGAEATYAYTKKGTYTVTLAVEDDDGVIDEETRSITIEPEEEPGFGAGFAVLAMVTILIGVASRRRH